MTVSDNVGVSTLYTCEVCFIFLKRSRIIEPAERSGIGDFYRSNREQNDLACFLRGVVFAIDARALLRRRRLLHRLCISCPPLHPHARC